jgi:putative MFS transporter
VASVSQTVVVPADRAEVLLAARHDIVSERPWTDDDQVQWDAGHHRPLPSPEAPDGARRATFALDRGPMTWYRREVAAHPVGDGSGEVEVSEVTRWRLSLGVWGHVIHPAVVRNLRRTEGRDRYRAPFWAPPHSLDERSGLVLGLLLSIALVTGYLGTVMTQTISFAADDFGRSTTAQGAALASVRIGTLGSLVLVAVSDRRGRRRLLLGSTAAACLATVIGAFAPTIEVLAATQTVARAFTTAATLLLAVVAAEEMPAGSRAYAISVMTMTGALGAGIAVWALPLADRDVRAWRILYLIPLLGLPVLVRVRRRLPESQRFTRPHRDATVVRGHARRFWAIGAALFCASAIGAPSSQLLVEFLREERGFAAARISLFTILTSTPAGIALVAGGRLADTRGRRVVVAAGIGGGSLLGAWAFVLHGWPLWVASLAATMLAALATPAMGAYGPELFPTGARAKANGILQVMSVAGSAVGLVVVGVVADRTGQVGDGMLVVLPLGLLVAVLALTVFPETAHRSLEQINPEDRLPADVGATVLATDEGPSIEGVVDDEPPDGPTVVAPAPAHDVVPAPAPPASGASA